MQIRKERLRHTATLATVGTVHVRDYGNGMEFDLWGTDLTRETTFSVTLTANEIDLLAKVLAKSREDNMR